MVTTWFVDGILINTITYIIIAMPAVVFFEVLVRFISRIPNNTSKICVYYIPLICIFILAYLNIRSNKVSLEICDVNAFGFPTTMLYLREDWLGHEWLWLGVWINIISAWAIMFATSRVVFKIVTRLCPVSRSGGAFELSPV